MYIYKSRFADVLPAPIAIPDVNVAVTRHSPYLDTWAGQGEEVKVVTPQSIKRYAVNLWDVGSPPTYNSINGLVRIMAIDIDGKSMSRPESPEPCRFSDNVFYMGRTGPNAHLAFGSTLGIEPVSFIDALRRIVDGHTKTRHFNELTHSIMTNYIGAITLPAELDGGAGENGAASENGNQ